MLEVLSQAPAGILRCQTGLECPTCRKETTHDVLYFAGRLRRIRCLHCGQQWQVARDSLEEAYLRQLLVRLASKPVRLGLEAGRHPVHFAATLPRRLVTKPWRMVSEVTKLAGIEPRK